MTSPLDGKVVPFGRAVDTFHAFLHQPMGDIETESGPMPNLRKLSNELRGIAADSAEQAASEKVQAIEDRIYPGVYSTPPTHKPHSGAPSADGDRCTILVGGVPMEHIRSGGGWLIPNFDAQQLAQAATVPAYAFSALEMQAIVDNAMPMQNFAALRAYTGRAEGVRFTTPGIAGTFRRAALTDARPDDGGTVIVDGLGRRWERLSTGAANVRWFGAIGNGIADDTNAIQAALDAYDCIWIPAGRYKVSRPIRASRVVDIDGDPKATIVAAAGFTGIDITFRDAPYTLKSIIAIFAGNDIGQQANPRIGEHGERVKVGPMMLDCANNCDYGLLANSCPGIDVHSAVQSANKFGQWYGPNCWGAAIWHPRINSCIEGFIYLGEACNGAAIYNPECWGKNVTTLEGIVLEGTPSGIVGAIGNIKISGGYIEDVVRGLVLKGSGSVTLLGVDIEGVYENCVVSDCSPGGQTGQINVIGGQLSSFGPAFFNRNGLIYVFGSGITDGAVLNPYYSDNADSMFVINGVLQFTSGALPAPFPDISNTLGAVARIESKYESIEMVNRITDPDAPFSRSRGWFTRAATDQPGIPTQALEHLTTRWGGPTMDYRGAVVQSAYVTTSDPEPRAKSAAQTSLGFRGAPGAEIKCFIPGSDDDTELGTPDNRWLAVYASRYHARSGAFGISETVQSADGKTLTFENGLLVGIVG